MSKNSVVVRTPQDLERKYNFASLLGLKKNVEITSQGIQKIENEIKTMPNYFAYYDTTVTFITQEELNRDHAGIPHGGFVIRTGKTGADTKQMIEYKLTLGSNPEFTSSVIVAYARAAYKMAQEGMSGAKTVFDVAPAYLSPKTPAELRKELL